MRNRIVVLCAALVIIAATAHALPRPGTGEVWISDPILVDSSYSMPASLDTTWKVTSYQNRTRTPGKYWAVWFYHLTSTVSTDSIPTLTIKSSMSPHSNGRLSTVAANGFTLGIVDSILVTPKVSQTDTVGVYTIVRPVGETLELNVKAKLKATKVWLYIQELREF
jgi:hypothetical protein